MCESFRLLSCGFRAIFSARPRAVRGEPLRSSIESGVLPAQCPLTVWKTLERRGHRPAGRHCSQGGRMNKKLAQYALLVIWVALLCVTLQ